MSDKLPRYNLPAIFQMRTRLLERVFLVRFHVALQGEELDTLVSDLRRNLPSGIKRDALFETARQIAGVELTPKLAFRFSWLLAGNIPLLRAGSAVRFWGVQPCDEWVPLQVIRADHLRNRKNELGFQFTFLALAGRAVTLRLEKFWPHRACRLVARNAGFTSRRGPMSYRQGAQLVGLRFLGKIEAARSHGQPWFFETRCPPSCLQYNRELLKKRFHIVPCPNGWTHDCCRCAVGFEACPAATHRKTYVLQNCPSCGETAPFDPEASSPNCVHCDERNRLRRHTESTN